MQKTIDAIYENGIFRPLKPLDWLDDNRRVTLTLQAPDSPKPLEGWAGGLSDEDAKLMRDVIDAEFGQVNPDDWK